MPSATTKAARRSAGPCSRVRAQASEPMNAGLLLHRPAEVGLDRVSVLGQLVAVEAVVDLQPQGVASPQPRRGRACDNELLPEGRGLVRGDENLDPVLAGVAGPADEGIAGAEVEVGGVEPGRQLPLRDRADDPPRLRPLDCEHRVVVDPVVNVRVEVVGVAPEPLEVALVVGRVGDGEEVVVAESVGEEVVEDAAVLAAEARVLGAADLDPRHVIRQQPLQQLGRLWALGLDLSHVGDVEDAASITHRQVLLLDPLVLNRHLPAGERDQLRPGLQVGLVQRGPPQRPGLHARDPSERFA